MSDHYWMEKVANYKQAEERAVAARYFVAVKAQQANGRVRRPAGAQIGGTLRTLAAALGFARTALTAAAHGPRL